jgi:hypothetical protein
MSANDACHFGRWANSSVEHLHWSHSFASLHDYLSGDDSIPYVFLETKRDPIEIMRIRPDGSLPIAQRGFILSSIMSKKSFESFVYLLSDRLSEFGANPYSKNRAFLCVSKDGPYLTPMYRSCRLSNTDSAEKSKCLSCKYNSRKNREMVIDCLIGADIDEEKYGEEGHQLAFFYSADYIEKVVFYAEDSFDVVRIASTCKGEFFGPMWKKDNDGSYTYQGYGKIERGRYRIWHMSSAEQFPDIDFNEGC